MLTLERPTHSALSSFETCISRINDTMLAARLNAATPNIVAASDIFDQAALGGTLHQIARQNVVAPDITISEMEKVYTQRMAKTNAPGRDIYDEIFSSSPNGRCPLCTQRPVATLDHYLPKAHFPALSVAPLNLIPACSDCNKAKRNAFAETEENVPLHPYYDDLGGELWLHATVIEKQPTAIKFTIIRPTGWTDMMFARVRRHFTTLGLAGLFASEAAEELLHVRHQLGTVQNADQREWVRQELGRRALSCAKVRPNGWRAATYKAWSESDWFCGGGFLPAG
jgi:hypothetical protein